MVEDQVETRADIKADPSDQELEGRVKRGGSKWEELKTVK